MRYQLDLTLRRAEGALVRVLGTTERRGFQPVSVDGGIQSRSGRADGDRWHLRMTVEGEREPESLQHQLAKLYDCLDVQVSPCA
ncbi:ACT domain-containing protein [Thermomonas sp.]|uniref:ACT domain-containing protein n=1 Tax=Thermomonas sp. TaxID=1971895 RepID=UPI0024879F96|nr:ACT domain-containing protein [Thermomonas sp.]MDI1252559.1 ACT domain-containing protein [Thermomonas sp.]